MDSVNQRSSRRWKNLRNRFGLKGAGCCGAIWCISSNQAPNLMNVREEEENGEDSVEIMNVGQIPVSTENDTLVPNQTVCVIQNPDEFTGMNLAAALAAERSLRGTNNDGRGVPSPPLRVSLMRLLREGDAVDGERKNVKARDRERLSGGCNDAACCVCMERSKGAAFIPCGHTFCRVCSRDIWLNRGSCAICNCKIVQILDIF